MRNIDIKSHWDELLALANTLKVKEPALSTLLNETILERDSFAECLSYRITRKLVNETASLDVLRKEFSDAFTADPTILQSIACDMLAVHERDPAICCDHIDRYHRHCGQTQLDDQKWHYHQHR